MNRLARLTLLAYPTSFRHDFGDDYLQTVQDMRAHGGHSTAGIAARLVSDAVVTAPAMRWEHTMTTAKTIVIAAIAVAAAFGIIIGAPFVALPMIVVLGALVVAARRHDRPIATETAAWATRWYAWLIAAGGLLLLGVAMLATSTDGELTSIAWATWMLSWIAAGVAAIVGLGLGATRLTKHRRA
jgi:hypothetical protein